MPAAQRLVSLLEDPGFSRIKRVATRGGERWELWLKDGVLHTFEGPTWRDVVEQAAALIARRGGR